MFYILIQLIRNNVNFNDRDIIYIKNLLSNNEVEAILSLFINRVEIIKTFNGLPIYPKTLNQLRYIEAIEKNVMVLELAQLVQEKLI